jgi:cytochrome c-type biogenesis protein CcmH
MRRLALPFAAALVIVVGVALGMSALGGDPPTRAEQAARLASELRCPDCQALSVAESRTTAASAIRAEIDEQLAAGKSMDEVRDHFVARYGEWILLSPRSALPWLVPVLALLVGFAGLLLWLGRTRGGAPGASAGPPPTDDDRQRVRDEVEALDA